MEKTALQVAEEKFGAVDFIINAFTMDFVWCSDAFAEHLQYSPTEMVGMSVRDIVDSAESPLLMMIAQIAKATGEPRTQICKRKDGETVSCTAQVHGFLFDKEPHVAGTNFTFG